MRCIPLGPRTPDANREELHSLVLKLLLEQANADIDEGFPLSHWETEDVQAALPWFSRVQIYDALESLVRQGELHKFVGRVLVPQRVRTIYYVNLERNPRNL